MIFSIYPSAKKHALAKTFKTYLLTQNKDQKTAAQVEFAKMEGGQHKKVTSDMRNKKS